MSAPISVRARSFNVVEASFNASFSLCSLRKASGSADNLYAGRRLTTFPSDGTKSEF